MREAQNRASTCMARQGFLMSIEAGIALTMLFVAAAALPAFQFQANAAPSFFLCSDAALSLAKSGAFSEGTLQEGLDGMGALSGMCIGAGGLVAQGCGAAEGAAAASEKISLSIIAFNGIAVERQRVSCWFPPAPP